MENSYPVITGRGGRDVRVDEMASTGHYHRWREDLALVRELALEYLRYGPPYYRVHVGPERYDWSFVDESMAELRRLGITPIADLCHFGVPDWVGNFQNPEWPVLFADYARAFAQRYPWVRFYTPVNEIFVAALFSARLGWWNERLSSDRAFVTALTHLARANLLAEEAILGVRASALFVQSESSEYFHVREPAALPRAQFLNELRFVSLDLCYGHEVSAGVYEYLLDGGLPRQEYRWFREHGAAVKAACILGTDYYNTNEHLVQSGQRPVIPSGEIFGYYVITRQFFDRYHLPVMHTETNQRSDTGDAGRWLWKQWANMLRLKEDGVPIVGFTWYSLLDQVDWDTARREDNGRVDPVGLFDLDRQIRPAGEAYREMVRQWRDIMPAESRCLMRMEPNHPCARSVHSSEGGGRRVVANWNRRVACDADTCDESHWRSAKVRTPKTTLKTLNDGDGRFGSPIWSSRRGHVSALFTECRSPSVCSGATNPCRPADRRIRR